MPDTKPRLKSPRAVAAAERRAALLRVLHERALAGDATARAWVKSQVEVELGEAGELRLARPGTRGS